MQKFLAGGLGITRLAGRQFGPAVQKAVAIDQDANQCHKLKIAEEKAGYKVK
ncbi:hypothetical protein Cflav_PD0574 [Pedosphaera parvula Ellin514]|uniref:Uncharacterized protein n=1 Tax=Pedosphaera parvula (strain Ellin514) TaxID=320771 RepID=B9XS21_PEDPL|nr:hypothetical protein Cflav_PD0574 [Pedosphaera parvula Ellin514]